MKRRYPKKDNVLLVNITRLGDMLQATPTIRGIKMENPECTITVLVEKQFEDICYSIPDIDQVYGLDLGMTVRSLAREQEGIIDAFEYVTEVVEELRGREFDYVLNMSSSAYTALLLRLLKIPRQGGWSSDAEGHRIIETDWARLFATSVFHNNRQYNSLNLVDIFRCSADVEQHPHSLVMKVHDGERDYVRSLISEFGFSNTGPLIAIQGGASQGKRQWAPQKFSQIINILTEQHGCRVVLTGSKKELPIINAICSGCNSTNVKVAAGRTSIPQLGALLEACDLLVTGDTGPMHIAVAVGTPVVAAFLASAYGFETGPYSEGNLILQPVISCGPCNPNKSCARPDCHDCLDPELVAELAIQRARGPVSQISPELADPRRVIVYRSFFDSHGFLELEPLNVPNWSDNRTEQFRAAYRRLWLGDLGGIDNGAFGDGARQSKSKLALYSERESPQAFTEMIELSKSGQRLIQELERLIIDRHSPTANLSRVNHDLAKLDERIETLGFDRPEFGPLARMFIFAKEGLTGTDPLNLASQMNTVYQDLQRRTEKLGQYMGEKLA